jgi:hypothetical protein
MGQKSRNKKSKSHPVKNNQVAQNSPMVSGDLPPRQKPSILQPSGAMPVQPVRISGNGAQKATLFTNMDYIREDIVRIMLLLAVMAIILVILALLNAKTPLLINAGQHFSSFMRLQ